MTKISSSMTRFHKRIFPLMWFGFLGVFLIVALSAGALTEAAPVLVLPIAMAAFGFAMMKKLVWDLADEVYDAGEYLLVKNGDVEERIPLAGIMNISATTFVNPPRITLRLVAAGRLGNEIAYSPAMQFSLNPFAKCKLAEDLVLRVHRARVAGR
jgi:hypothetical protein